MSVFAQVNIAVLSYWNDFAEKHGYEKLPKLNARLKKQIRKRVMVEDEYLSRMPMYFDLIHTYCGGRNVFGDSFGLRSFLSGSTMMKALRLAGMINDRK